MKIFQRSVKDSNDGIDSSVIIYISKGDSAVCGRHLKVGTRFAADILELAISQIAQNRIGLLILAIGELGDVIENVAAGDEQIFPAIIIEIEDSVSPSRHSASHCQLSGKRLLHELAATHVTK